MNPDADVPTPDPTTWPDKCAECGQPVSTLLLGDNTLLCDPPLKTRRGWFLKTHVCPDPSRHPSYVMTSDEHGTEVAAADSPEAIRGKIRDLAALGLVGTFTVKTVAKWAKVEIREDQTYVIQGPGFTEGPGYIVI